MPELIVWIGEAIATAGAVEAGSIIASYATEIAIASAIAISAEQASNQRSRAKAAYNANLKDREVMFQSATAASPSIYGRALVSGPIAYAASNGDKRQFLHLVIPLAMRECDAVEQIWFGDTPLTMDGSGYVDTSALVSSKKADFQETLVLGAGEVATLARAADSVVGVSYQLDANWTDNTSFTHTSGTTLVTCPGRGVGNTVTIMYRANAAVLTRARIKIHLGGSGQVADADLIAECPGDWTTADIGVGVCYLYARLEYDADIYGQIGLPQIKALTRGFKVYDPRKDTTAGGSGAHRVATPSTWEWTDNARLCTDDYLRSTELGFGATAAETPAAEAIVEANLCDELVSITDAGVAATASYFNSGLDGWSALLQCSLAASGGVLRVTSSGADPIFQKTGVNFPGAGNTTVRARIKRIAGSGWDGYCYYTTSGHSYSALYCKSIAQPTYGADGWGVAEWDMASLSAGGSDWTANTITAFRLDLGNSSSDVFDIDWIVVGGEATQKRYTINGTLSSEAQLRDNLSTMMTTMDGTCLWLQGRWLVRCGYYRAPGASDIIDEGTLARGDITIQPRSGRAELFNGVSGVFIDPKRLYAEAQFKTYLSGVYVTEDGSEEIIRDVRYDLLDDDVRCQRMAKILLLRSRQAMVIELTCNYKAYNYLPGDNVKVSLARYGFVNKVFTVVERTWVSGAAIKYILRETASVLWDWAFNEQAMPDPATNSTLPNWTDVPSVPSGLVVTSGTSTLLLLGDGSIMTRAKLVWDATTDMFVASGGSIQIQWKRIADTAWNDGGMAAGADTSAYIAGTPDKQAIAVRIRAITSVGKISDWAYKAHTSIGESAAPANVSGLAVTVKPGQVESVWTNNTEADYLLTEVRSGASWSAGTLRWAGRASEWTWARPTPGSYTLWFAHKDRSGNYSASPQFFYITFAASDIDPTWASITGAGKPANDATVGTALNADPYMLNTAEWTLYSDLACSFATVTDGKSGLGVARSQYAGATSWMNGTRRLAVNPTKTYRVSAWMRTVSGSGSTAYVGVALFDIASENIPGDGSQWYYGAASSTNPPSSWTYYSALFGAGTARVFPSNARTMTPLYILSYGGGSSVHEIQDLRIEEVTEVVAAQASANTAQASANTAIAAITNIASDSILSPGEKPAIVQDYAVIVGEQAGIDAQATAYGITTEKTAYDTAITTLTSYLGGLSGWNTVPGSDVAIVGTTFRSNFAAVFAARQALLNKTAEVAGTRAGWAGVTGAGKPADNASADVSLVAVNCTLVGNSVLKTGGTYGVWDASAYSRDSFTGGAFCSFSASATYTSMAGLNSDPTTDDSYASIDYAWYCTGGSLNIYESGVGIGSFGAYSSTDVLSVAYDGVAVRYVRNGVVLRTVLAVITAPLFFDSSLYNLPGSSISNIRFGPMPSTAYGGLSLYQSVGTSHRISGNNIDINAGATSWANVVQSRYAMSGGAACSFVPATTGAYYIAGLDSNPTGRSVVSFDYTIITRADGTVNSREGGVETALGSFATGDVLGIFYDGASVKYTKNGAVLRTVAAAAGSVLYFAASIIPGYKPLTNIQFGPMSAVNYANLGSFGVAGGGNVCINGGFTQDALGAGLPTNFGNYNSGSIALTNTLIAGGPVAGSNYWRITAGATVTTNFGWYFATAAYAFGGYKANTNYTISFYARCSANPSASAMAPAWNNTPGTFNWLQNPVLTTSWQRYVCVLNFGAGTIDANGFFFPGANNFASGTTFDYACIGVEQGDAPSGWAPAPLSPLNPLTSANKSAHGYTGDLSATKNAVFQGATTPSSPQNNDTWVRNDLNPTVAYTYQGGTWVLTANYVSNTNQISDGANLGGTADWASGLAGKPVDTDLLNTHTQGSVLVINHPAGANASSGNATSGAIKIRLPQRASNTMVRFFVEVYVYAADESFTLEVGGYCASGWANTYARQVGSAASEHPVYFGHDGTMDCVWIGDPGNSWPYPQVAVTNFRAGYNNYTEAQWKSGWSVTFDTSAHSGHNITQTHSKPLTGASWSQVSGTGRPADNATAGATWGSNLAGQPSDAALLNANQLWAQVGGTGRPADNATVGAQGGVNLKDAAGNVLTDNEFRNSIESDTTYIMAPAGGSYSYNGTYAAAIRIRLPQYRINTMVRFSVEVYEYDKGSSVYDISGYIYSDGSWINASVGYTGDPAVSRRVRLGESTSKAAVWIGEPSGNNWNYPKVRVVRFLAGYNNYAASLWQAGWVVDLDTGAPTNVTKDVAKPSPGGALALYDQITAANSSAAIGAGAVATSQVAVGGITDLLDVSVAGPITLGTAYAEVIRVSFGPYAEAVEVSIQFFCEALMIQASGPTSMGELFYAENNAALQSAVLRVGAGQGTSLGERATPTLTFSMTLAASTSGFVKIMAKANDSATYQTDTIKGLYILAGVLKR